MPGAPRFAPFETWDSTDLYFLGVRDVAHSSLVTNARANLEYRTGDAGSIVTPTQSQSARLNGALSDFTWAASGP